MSKTKWVAMVAPSHEEFGSVTTIIVGPFKSQSKGYEWCFETYGDNGRGTGGPNGEAYWVREVKAP